ncbi:MAG: HAD family hydrolase [Saccharofermentanales bacterium]
MIEAAIFDLDGTLLDTIEDLADSVNYSLKSFGLPELGYEDYKKFIGKGAFNLCETSLKKSIMLRENGVYTGYPDADTILSVYRERYEANIKNKTKPYAGILKQLLLLQNAGIRMSVISNKPDNFTKDLVSEYFPDIRFDFVIGDCEKFPKKPDPESVKYVTDKSGVSHKNTAFVGDSEIDMYTAIAAGVVPVGVLWGFREKETLEAAGAKILIKEVNDLYKDLTAKMEL